MTTKQHVNLARRIEHAKRNTSRELTPRSQEANAAPGFRDLILARRVITTTDVERYNANYVGGDITGGAMDLRQMLARPVLRFDPYSTPNAKIFICSASTPPGPGVHGMCGYNAARSVMRRL